MKKLLGILLLAFPVLMQAQPQKAIVSGVSWYDQRGETVSAHGANIIRDGGRYYLFGEYKTDSANVFTGFSCYSSDNLVDWRFESIAFKQQSDGRMGLNRVGERPKVLRCPTTGEYVMLCTPTTCATKTPAPAMPPATPSPVPTSFEGQYSTKDSPSNGGTSARLPMMMGTHICWCTMAVSIVLRPTSILSTPV